MKDYLLLFRGGDARRAELQTDPAQWQAHREKWKTWMEGLGKEGKFVSGLPLANEGTVINGSGKSVTDGPFTEGKEIVGGYLIIKAEDRHEAVKLSSGCPVLEHEGSVEIRELLSMNM
jgi:hypothetical protein